MDKPKKKEPDDCECTNCYNHACDEWEAYHREICQLFTKNIEENYVSRKYLNEKRDATAPKKGCGMEHNRDNDYAHPSTVSNWEIVGWFVGLSVIATLMNPLVWYLAWRLYL